MPSSTRVEEAHCRSKSAPAQVPITPKKVDDIMGGDAAWDDVDKTEARCPACGHREAFFMQMQLRSADEPMTVFYKCTNCGHRWNE